MPQLSAGEKKVAAIVAVVGLLFVAVVGVSVAVLTIGTDHDDAPYLQATTGTRLVHVEPTIFCEIDLTGCRKGADGTFAQRLPVPVGDSVVVSVSRDIANAPWSLTLEFLTPRGFEQEPSESFAPGERYAFTVTSTPGKILSNIEVRLPSARTDAGGAPITRGFWSINTLPKDAKVPTGSS